MTLIGCSLKETKWDRTKERTRFERKSKDYKDLAIDCGTFGRTVASDTRGPKFESSHYKEHFKTFNCMKRRQNTEKSLEIGHF